jgi:hypothetical protein
VIDRKTVFILIGEILRIHKILNIAYLYNLMLFIREYIKDSPRPGTLYKGSTINGIYIKDQY